MAKKKETPSSPFVPVEEQPYRVPDNWCWVRLGTLGYTNIGLTYKPSDKSEKGTLVLRSGNIQDGKMDYTDVVKVDMEIPQDKMSKCGDILICARNGSKALVGKTAIIDRDGMSYGAFMAIFRSPFNNFVFYFLNSHYFRSIIDQSVGTSTINQVTQALIKQLPFPFPPLPEQQRIVSCIESLFAKLDEAKEKAQAVVDGFELRKSAILHKAFTGELTARWRKEHGVGMDSWENAPLETVCMLRSGSTIPAEQELSDGEIPYVKVADMNLPENEIQITTSSRFVNDAPNSHLIPFGSTIFPKRGGAILTNKKRFVGISNIICDLNTMAIIPDTNRMYGWYGFYWMQSIDLRELNNGSNVPQINNKDMVKLFISLPSLEEQAKIISIMDSLFEKEQQAKEAAEAVLDRIDTMKKAILARAYRGELGTNDPQEEWAGELVGHICRSSWDK